MGNTLTKLQIAFETPSPEEEVIRLLRSIGATKVQLTRVTVSRETVALGDLSGPGVAVREVVWSPPLPVAPIIAAAAPPLARELVYTTIKYGRGKTRKLIDIDASLIAIGRTREEVLEKHRWKLDSPEHSIAVSIHHRGVTTKPKKVVEGVYQPPTSTIDPAKVGGGTKPIPHSRLVEISSPDHRGIIRSHIDIKASLDALDTTEADLFATTWPRDSDHGRLAAAIRMRKAAIWQMSPTGRGKNEVRKPEEPPRTEVFLEPGSKLVFKSVTYRYADSNSKPTTRLVIDIDGSLAALGKTRDDLLHGKFNLRSDEGRLAIAMRRESAHDASKSRSDRQPAAA